MDPWTGERGDEMDGRLVGRDRRLVGWVELCKGSCADGGGFMQVGDFVHVDCQHFGKY